MNPDQVNPNFEKIIPLCLKELDVKFPDYGNSWLKMTPEYWQKRLANEVEEYAKAIGGVAKKRKLINIINIAAMAHETTSIDQGRL